MKKPNTLKNVIEEYKMILEQQNSSVYMSLPCMPNVESIREFYPYPVVPNNNNFNSNFNSNINNNNIINNYFNYKNNNDYDDNKDTFTDLRVPSSPMEKSDSVVTTMVEKSNSVIIIDD